MTRNASAIDVTLCKSITGYKSAIESLHPLSILIRINWPVMTHANQSSLTLNFDHEFDEDVDKTVKESIRSFLISSHYSAQDITHDIDRQFKVGQHYPGGYVDQVEDTFIFVSKVIPADHAAQDRLVDLVKEIRELTSQIDRPS